MKPRSLVTGGAGFIGANLVRELLSKNFEVHVLVRADSDLWRLEEVKDEIKFVSADLVNAQEVDHAVSQIHPKYIFHLAAYGSYPYQQDERRMFETNVLGTVNLLHACQKTGFKKLIVTGSSSEYGAKDHPMKETEVLEPNTAYGVSKAAGTLYCQYRAKEANLPIVIFRPFSVYGPWEEKTRLVPSLISRSLAGEDLELTSPEVARDFVYVGDVAEAFMQVLENDRVNGEVLNLASGRQSTIKEVVELALKLTGASVKTHWNREEVRRLYDAKTWVGDSQKAKTLFGWQVNTSLEEGFKKTVEWFKEYVAFYN